MRNLSTIFKRELSSYFNSAIAYLFLIVFILINCGLFMTSFFLNGVLEMRSFFHTLPFILIVFIPAISMRSWSEDKRIGTIELLLTFPMQKRSIIFGKFLAGCTFYGIALLSTITIPILLSLLGKPDYGPILTGYLGVFLLGIMFLSIGIFISGLFKDQISSFILSVVIVFSFYIFGTDFMATFIDGWISGFGSFLKNYLGISHRLESFQKGVITFSDTFYFLAHCLLFLILNNMTLTSETRQRHKGTLFLFSIFTVGIFLFSNLIVSDFVNIRTDLTKNKNYTISDSSKKILKSLKVPITVSFYVSNPNKMPTAMKNLRRDVLDKLNELSVQSNGKVQITVQDPSDDQTLAENLAQRGIQPFQVQSIEEDALGVKLVYAAITLAYLDKKEEIINQIHPGRLSNLEYELISKIYRLTLDKKPHVSIAAPYTSVDPQMVQLMQQLGQQIPSEQDDYENLKKLLQQENYQVSRIRLDQNGPLPEDSDTLVFIAPEKLTPRQMYEIDQFLSKGKNVILIAQNHRFQYRPNPSGNMDIIPTKVGVNFNELTQHWGITLNEKVLFDASHEVLSIPTEQDIGGFLTAMVEVPVKVPSQIKVLPENLNSEISITSSLGPLLYLWGSALQEDSEKLKELNIQKTTLIQGSQTCWLFENPGVPLSSSDFEPNHQNITKNPILGILLKGSFPVLYSHLETPPEWTATDNPEVKPKPSSTSSQLILIGCSEMFNNNVLAAHSNVHLFLNLVDAVTLGEDLIHIRSKEVTNQYIRPVEKAEKIIFRITVPLLTSLLWAIFGIMALTIKRKKREQYYILLKNQETEASV